MMVLPSKSAEYVAYSAIKQRCTNSNHPSWKRYGGRGIRVEFPSFEQFLAHVGPRPTPQHSIDRYPDNDGPYAAGNVRWATANEQRDKASRPVRDAHLSVRIERNLKREAEAVLRSISLTPAAAMNMFYRQIVLHQSLPFDVRIPNAETAML